MTAFYSRPTWFSAMAVATYLYHATSNNRRIKIRKRNGYWLVWAERRDGPPVSLALVPLLMAANGVFPGDYGYAVEHEGRVTVGPGRSS